MGFKCAIVGLPNVGKSTLFNALTRAEIAAENYPFCTIDPNVGVVPVPDPRLHKIAAIVQPEKTIPTTLEFVDIAGLVAGASRGEGLGNKFLAHIRETDAIAHIVRCFESSDVVHVDGRVDPLSDIETIDTELILADLESAERMRDKAQRDMKSGDKEAAARFNFMQRICQHLGEGKPLRTMDLDDNDRRRLRALHLITRKPVMFVANVDEQGFSDNPLLTAITKHADQHGALLVTICAAIEAEIAMLDESDRQDFLAELGVQESGLDRMTRAGYELLDLLTFFTVGQKEVKAWTVRRGTVAPRAAGRIHTDFERGFIRAEVIAYEDFIRFDGEQGARDAGKHRLEGKTYVIQEADVVRFRFNV